MMELWSKDQINEALNPDRIQQIIERAFSATPDVTDTKLVFRDGGTADILAIETHGAVIRRSGRVVVSVDRLTAQIDYSPDGVEIYQVSRKVRTVYVKEFEPVRKRTVPHVNLTALEQ